MNTGKFWSALICLMLAAAGGFASLGHAAAPLPADCPTLPTDPNNTMSLELTTRLAPRPGMPQGGYAQFGLNHVPANGTLCETAQPDLPRDVLQGEPSRDVLEGEHGTDILTGQPRGRVIIETR
jgi:hypothetical protein